MWDLRYINLIFFLYSATGESYNSIGNPVGNYVSPSSTYWKRELDSGNSNSGNSYGNYAPSGFKPPFDLLTFQKCYEFTVAYMQESGYIPGKGKGAAGDGDKEEESSSNNFANMMSNEQFQEIFKQCMEGEKPSTSTYRKREADSGSSGSSNPFGSYVPSGFKPPFGFESFESWQKCTKYAMDKLQGSGYFPGKGRGAGGDGDKEEESSSNNFANMMSNEQFQEIFKQCMEGEKPSTSTYRKREADSGSSGSSNPFGSYVPSGFKPPFGFESFESWQKCTKYAMDKLQGSGYFPGKGRGAGGDGDKEEESSSNNFANMMSNEQFQEIFKQCMEGEKPSTSTYRKREADSGSSGSSNPFGSYVPSGFKPPFGFESFESWQKCTKYAMDKLQGSGYFPGKGRGAGGDGDKEEESSSNNFANMMSNEQFQEIFKQCMEGEKPSTSTYRKREADSGSSGSSNPFGSYAPSGFKPPFGFESFESWQKCTKYAMDKLQGSGYFPGKGRGAGGDGDKEEESSSNNFANMMSNEQFQEIFKQCMEGEKPSTSTYRKREADSGSSGSSNPFGSYVPSGFKPPFGFESFESWQKCTKYAMDKLQGSGYFPGKGRGAGGDGDKEEESSSNNFANMMSNEQFQEIFKQCMEGEKPSTSTYRKREADSGSSGSSNPFGSYVPSGFKPPFGFESFESWQKCTKYAMDKLQGSGYFPGKGRGAGGDGDKEEESSSNNFANMMSNEQFQEIFKQCMEGEKPSTSTYRKREANLKRRVKKSACNGDQTEKNNVLRHISLFY